MRILFTLLACALLSFGCSASDSGSDPAGDPATDPGPETGTETGTEPGTETGMDPGTETGTDPGTETGTETGKDPVEAPTWRVEIGPILEAACVRCHSEGGIREVTPLDDYDDAVAVAPLLLEQVQTRVMPPWGADPVCAEYDHDESLTDAQILLIEGWVAAGTPEGDPGATPMDVPPQDIASLSRVDIELAVPEPYVPQIEPDDYRCFLIDWEATEPMFVTGFGVTPGNPQIVHHVIPFVVPPSKVAAFEAMDAAEDGPGYTCFGAPAAGDPGLGGLVSWLGAWAPGPTGVDYPEGTGIPIEPGSKIGLQMHYNVTAPDPAPDQTHFQLRLESEVEREAFILPWANIQWLQGQMQIPAGEAEVTHEFALDPTTYFGGPGFRLHSAGLHMHLWGKSGRAWIERQDGTEECLVNLPVFDYGWQRVFRLKEPVDMVKGDKLGIECVFDNSQANQPWIGDTQMETTDIGWGDGTQDEMCLGLFYVSFTD